MRIGYITDLHYRGAVPGSSRIAKRQSRSALRLLEGALAHFQEQGVDALICAGDLVDDSSYPEVGQDLHDLHAAMARLDVPAWVIPGNHDPKPEAFFQHFPRPPRLQRIRDCRIIASPDEYPAPGDEIVTRSDAALDEMRRLLDQGTEGLQWTLCLQHYLIWPEHMSGYPYNYGNAARIRQILEAAPGRVLSISGHYHRGAWVTRHNGVTYFAGSALCEAPFPCYVIDVGGDRVAVRLRHLEL